MSMRESAVEENRLSALAGIRNAVDQTASLRTQLAAKDAQIAALLKALIEIAKTSVYLKGNKPGLVNSAESMARIARAALEMSGGVL